MRFIIISRLFLTVFMVFLAGFSGCDKEYNSSKGLYLARQLRKEGKYTEALKTLDMILKEARDPGEKSLLAQCWMEIGFNYWNAGEIDKSEEAFQKVTGLDERMGFGLKYRASNALEIVRLYRKAKKKKAEKNYEEAEYILLKARELAKRYGFKEMELKCTFRLGFIYFDKNDIESFLKCNNECLLILEECFNPDMLTRCLANLGFIFFNKKELLKSYEYFDQAKTISEKLNIQDEYPEVYSNLGTVLYYLGQYDLSEYYFEKALQIYSKKQDFESAISILYGLALSIYKSLKTNGLGFYEDRIESLLYQALELSRRMGYKNVEARIINNLGYIYLEQGKDLNKAEELSLQALSLGKRLNENEVISASLNNLGEVYLRKGELKKAVSLFSDSLKIARVFDYWPVIWNDYCGLARCQERNGNYGLALRYYQKALRTIEKLRTNITIDLYRMGFDSEKKEVYEGIIRSLIKLRQQKKLRNLDELIFFYVNKLKARVFLEEISNLSDQAPRINEFSEELSAIDRWIGDVLSGAEAKNGREIRTEVQELDYRYFRLLNHGRLNGSGNYNLPLLTLEDIKKECLVNKSVILDYYLGREESYCFLISHDEFRPFLLPGEAEVEKSIKLYIKLLSRLEVSTDELKRAGFRIRKLILPDEMLGFLGEQSLIIVPDGLLNFLPFESLVISDEKRNYLLEEYSISYLPSMAVLARIKHRRNGGFRRNFLGVGNPVYSSEQKAQLNNYLKLINTSLKEDRGPLRNLPFAEVELKQIVSLFAAGEYELLLGKKASEENIKRINLKDYRVIHFACHGFSDEKNPLRSVLVLSAGKVRQEDGFLTLKEIYNLKLDSDLVVLSACESSLGAIIKKEGVIGFPRLFLLAGSRAVLSTLWSVNDKTTAEFMKVFYQELLAGHDKDVSLRKAKLRMMASGKSHPYYWAPFILSGSKDRLY